jgi:hypothetical protein
MEKYILEKCTQPYSSANNLEAKGIWIFFLPYNLSSSIEKSSDRIYSWTVHSGVLIGILKANCFLTTNDSKHV